MTMANRIRKCREWVGLDAYALSRLIGKAPSYIGLLESGRRHHPRADTLELIASVLGVSIDWLVSGRGRGPSSASVRAAVERAKAQPEAEA